MDLLRIESPQNTLIKDFMRLQKSKKFRHETGRIALEGPNLVREARNAGIPLQVVLTTDEYLTENQNWFDDLPSSVKLVIASAKLFKLITDTESPREVAAIAALTNSDHLLKGDSPNKLILILDRIQDPGNMGTIIRSSAGAGVDYLYYSTGTVDPYGPKVMRSSAGALFKIYMKQVKLINELVHKIKNEGIQLIATSAHSGKLYWEADFSKPSAIIIGNEASGINRQMINEADITVRIPLSEKIESLNAAVAASLLLFEAVRQRSA
ncbi:MAG: RNA methyltransferase [Bacillota bacterium]|nr:RNA methyltransferase [Bacillota bacterium]